MRGEDANRVCVLFLSPAQHEFFVSSSFIRQHNLRWRSAQITTAIHVSMCVCAHPARRHWCTVLPCDLGGLHSELQRIWHHPTEIRRQLLIKADR